MRKTFYCGNIDYCNTCKKTTEVTVDIELKYDNGKPCFTASGRIGIHTAGQCLDTIAEHIKTPRFNRIYRLWKLYHLNDMNAGTPEQDELIEAWRQQNDIRGYDYGQACEYLKSIGKYEVEHDGKPYKYGSAWLYRAIPQKDLDDICNLLGIKKDPPYFKL